MSLVALTKAELRRTRQNLARLLPPGGRPLSAAEVVEVNADLEKIDRMIVESATTIERGRLVFSWRVPREQAWTMNQYAQAKGWQKKKMRSALDDAINKLLPLFPGALTNGSLVKRWVRVTRFSPQRLDDLSVDSCGGKMPVDALKRCGVIADDNVASIHREPRYEKCKPGDTHVLVEVFLIASEQVAAPEPAFAKVQQVVRVPGLMTQALIGKDLP